MSDALGTPGGVVTDEGHRLALAGAIAPQSSTLAVRTGVMWGPGTTTLITGTAATGTMTVNVAAHHWVTSRSTGDGVYLGAKETSTTVNIAAAPGANSRIDVVYSKENDAGSTISPDGSTGELYGVVTGTAAVSPTKPALPVGAVEIGTVTVATGATSTNGAGVTVANTAAQTVARGADIPVRSQAERDALTTFPFLTVKRLDTGNIEARNPSNTAWLTVFDSSAVAPPWTTFTPGWTAASAAPSIGNGTISGRYRQVGKTVQLSITLSFGSTTSGGAGGWQFTGIPVAALASREQVITCKAFTAGTQNWGGYGLLNGTTVAPYLPLSNTNAAVGLVQNASSGSSPGTGVPAVSAAFTFSTGHNLILSGSYEAA